MTYISVKTESASIHAGLFHSHSVDLFQQIILRDVTCRSIASRSDRHSAWGVY